MSDKCKACKGKGGFWNIIDGAIRCSACAGTGRKPESCDDCIYMANMYDVPCCSKHRG